MPEREIIRRLIDLRSLLSRRGTVTVREIIDAFPQHYGDREQSISTARRNVQNDMQSLMAFESHITVHRSRNGGYNIWTWTDQDRLCTACRRLRRQYQRTALRQLARECYLDLK
jgi:hypothetical protein